MIGRLAWLCLLLPSLALAADAETIATITTRLRPAAALRGEFVQEKALVGFRHALRSSGRFLVARERGVVWDTRQPFASTLVIGADGLRSDGERLVDGDAALARVNALLVAVISGRFDALEADFAIEVLDAAADRWQLRLTPRQPALAEVIAWIELRGNAFVDAVTFADAAGNRTSIEFRAQQAGALDPDESARFD